MSNVPNIVNIHEDTPNQVIVNQDAPNQVVIRLGGGTGALTPTTRHVHTQAQASTTWTVTHQLGGRPSVTIVDSADTHVFGEVQYLSNSQVMVTFSAAFSGKAYLT